MPVETPDGLRTQAVRTLLWAPSRDHLARKPGGTIMLAHLAGPQSLIPPEHLNYVSVKPAAIQRVLSDRIAGRP
jgi:hypothetical protein